MSLISATVKLNVALEQADAFNLLADPETAAKFLNGVNSYTLLTGSWSVVGDKRRISLDNGATILETIKVMLPNSHFTYEIADFSGSPKLFKLIVVKGKSQCWFKQSEIGTHITWRFSFQARNLFLAPVLWIFMKVAYKRYMKSAARKIENSVDRL